MLEIELTYNSCLTTPHSALYDDGSADISIFELFCIHAHL